MTNVCCCVFGLVATVRALILFPFGMPSTFTKRKKTKYTIREREEVNHKRARMKVGQFLMLDLTCIRQSRRQHKGESIFYSQTVNFNEQDHKDGKSPLHWYMRLRALFRPKWSIIANAANRDFRVKRCKQKQNGPLWIQDCLF